MSSIELNRLQAVTGPRALSEADRTPTETRAQQSRTPPSGSTAQNGVSIEVASTIDSSSPPVDQDRVAEIREALKDGSYPLVPTEIADAMIAAQLSFRIEQ